ncbi:sugar kinase [Aeromicrobium camelliae]|uniref:Sugar kinase n=1 Tax=Aeromicrobium camelliae TaxID=1538144 RepID=A0A3N6WPU9_9ACTN|nr:sugar kinase [Aeromicrobium camelliae]RQN09330.1 sugar kinase [Aeromicrobium camelliae]
MSVDVLTVGETMTAVRCDGLLRLGGRASLSIAGAESNLAIAMARLGHRVAWSGRVGADESGELVRRTLAAEGVDASTVVRDPDAPTGLLVFEQRLPDLTRVEYHRRHSAGSRWCRDDVQAALDLRPRVVHVTGVTAALSESAREALTTLVDESRARGALVSFDVNFRSRLWSAADAAPVLASLARRADVVIASPDELDLVADEPGSLLQAGVREVVIKRGADGATVLTSDGEVSAPARRVRVVDSIGAGDAFGAGYLSALVDGGDVTERLRRGVVLGAFAVASSGDWEGLPTREELALIDVEEGQAIR